MIVIRDIPDRLYNNVLHKLTVVWNLPFKYEDQWDPGERALLNRYQYILLQVVDDEVAIMCSHALQIRDDNTYYTAGEVLNADSVDELLVTALL